MLLLCHDRIHESADQVGRRGRRALQDEMWRSEMNDLSVRPDPVNQFRTASGQDPVVVNLEIESPGTGGVKPGAVPFHPNA